MTQYEIPEARGLGREGSEFRATIDHLAEFHNTFDVVVEYPTAFAVTCEDRRVIVTAAPMADGRMSIEIRGFVDDAMVEMATYEAGMARLLVI
jgi:hypothetical protein